MCHESHVHCGAHVTVWCRSWLVVARLWWCGSGCGQCRPRSPPVAPGLFPWLPCAGISVLFGGFVMRGGLRVGAGLLVAGLLVSGLGVGVVPSAPAAPSSVLLRDPGVAMVEARRSGLPVEVSALTDEYMRVVADPVSGRFTAEVSAGVARVSDGVGGWRLPDLTLVVGSDGRVRPVAARLPMSVSGGGGGDLVSLSVSGTSVGLGLPVVLPTPLLSGDTATYVEVLPGVDVVARVGVDTVSTFVVVKTRQAGLDPVVRALRFALSGSSQGTARVSGAGEVVVPDGAGRDRVRVSAAAMWDSKGGAVGLASRDRVVAADQARVGSMGVAVAAGRLDVSPDTAFLDDPGTVYPVVIDPTLSDAGATYFKRFVSSNCFSYSSNTTDGLYTGNKARVGYDGWDTSSCGSYYESQVFYRFNWPTSLNGANIYKAEFVHENSYSVQHSPCDYTTGFGRGIDVGLTGGFSSSASSWSSRPGFINSTQVYNDYAAGASPSYCSVTKDVSWDLTSQMRSVYGGAAFTEFYVGMAAHVLGDKYSWRHFDNVWGAGSSSRPLVRVTFVPAPAPPTAVQLVDAKAARPGVTGLYTGTNYPSLRAVLPTTTYCMSGNSCYYVQYIIRDVANSAISMWFQSPRALAGSTVWATLPSSVGSLDPGHTYSVTAYTINGDYQPIGWGPSWSSAVSVTSALWWWKADLAVAPTWDYVNGSNGIVASGGTWSTSVSSAATIPVWKFCVGKLADGDPFGVSSGCVVASGRSATVTSQPLLNTSGSRSGTAYELALWACYDVAPCVKSSVNALVTAK